MHNKITPLPFEPKFLKLSSRDSLDFLPCILFFVMTNVNDGQFGLFCVLKIINKKLSLENYALVYVREDSRVQMACMSSSVSQK
jgi:hypothetical protein